MPQISVAVVTMTADAIAGSMRINRMNIGTNTPANAANIKFITSDNVTKTVNAQSSFQR